jgi:hypothetical protein
VQGAVQALGEVGAGLGADGHGCVRVRARVGGVAHPGRGARGLILRALGRLTAGR